MARIEPIEIPVSVTGPALRIVALDRAIGRIANPAPGQNEAINAERVVDMAKIFEAYLTGKATDQE